ncbi:MAG: DUF2281 domain-containing protein [Blastochloris sp.]|nr:DUF2281 domain-containing protein [Blastochloris sp.]
MHSIEAELNTLPGVEFLLTKRDRPTPRRLRQDWAGALHEAEQYTSVDLQHLALEWRED